MMHQYKEVHILIESIYENKTTLLIIHSICQLSFYFTPIKTLTPCIKDFLVDWTQNKNLYGTANGNVS